MSTTTFRRSTPSTHSTDDEWEDITSSSQTVDVQGSSSASSVFSKAVSETPDTFDAAHSALEAILAALVRHVTAHSFERVKSHRVLSNTIYSALREFDVCPSEIVNFIRISPRIALPSSATLTQMKELNSVRARYGKHYGVKRSGGPSLCEDVLKLCVDMYLDLDSDYEPADHTVDTTATTQMREKQVAKPSQEFMKRAIPAVTAAPVSDSSDTVVREASDHRVLLRSILSQTSATTAAIPKPDNQAVKPGQDFMKHATPSLSDIVFKAANAGPGTTVERNPLLSRLSNIKIAAQQQEQMVKDDFEACKILAIDRPINTIKLEEVGRNDDVMASYYSAQLWSCVSPYVNSPSLEGIASDAPPQSTIAARLWTNTAGSQFLVVLKEEERNNELASPAAVPNSTPKPPLSSTQQFEKVLTEHSKGPSPITAPSAKPLPASTPRKYQFGCCSARPSAKALAKEWKEPANLRLGTSEPPVLIRILVVLWICLFSICTGVLFVQNFRTIMASGCTFLSYTATVGGSWSLVWWVVKAPFLFLIWCVGLFGGCVGEHAGVGVANSTTTMADMQTIISEWAALKDIPKSDFHTTLFGAPSSPTKLRYESWHKIGRVKFKLDSVYPFTRHNNSVTAADRCEWLVNGFGYYWREEMTEKMGKEGDERMFDLEFGNELARALVKHCK